MKYICNTDFILRYLLGDDPEMLTKTQAVFEQAKAGELTLVIAPSVFSEVVLVLSSFYEVPREKISQLLGELLAYKGVSGDKKVLSLALDYYCKHPLHIASCLLLAKAALTKTPLLTFDPKLNALTQAS